MGSTYRTLISTSFINPSPSICLNRQALTCSRSSAPTSSLSSLIAARGTTTLQASSLTPTRTLSGPPSALPLRPPPHPPTEARATATTLPTSTTSPTFPSTDTQTQCKVT